MKEELSKKEIQEYIRKTYLGIISLNIGLIIVSYFGIYYISSFFGFQEELYYSNSNTLIILFISINFLIGILSGVIGAKFLHNLETVKIIGIKIGIITWISINVFSMLIRVFYFQAFFLSLLFLVGSSILGAYFYQYLANKKE